MLRSRIPGDVCNASLCVRLHTERMEHPVAEQQSDAVWTNGGQWAARSTAAAWAARRRAELHCEQQRRQRFERQRGRPAAVSHSLAHSLGSSHRTISCTAAGESVGTTVAVARRIGSPSDAQAATAMDGQRSSVLPSLLGFHTWYLFTPASPLLSVQVVPVPAPTGQRLSQSTSLPSPPRRLLPPAFHTAPPRLSPSSLTPMPSALPSLTCGKRTTSSSTTSHNASSSSVTTSRSSRHCRQHRSQQQQTRPARPPPPLQSRSGCLLPLISRICPR